MKTTIICLSLLLIIGSFCAAETPTNMITVYNIPGPLPEEFDGMAKTNVYRGVTTVAIYVHRNDSACFTCVGAAFKVDTNKIAVLVPEHLFPKGESGCYAVRAPLARSNNIIGFLDKPLLWKADVKGIDAAIFDITNKPVTIEGYSTRKFADAGKIVLQFTNNVVAEHRSSTKFYSMITGRPVRLLGYGFESADANARPYIAIETKNHVGYSGTPFFDEHGRIFLLHAGMPGNVLANSPLMPYLRLAIGHAPIGIAFIDGPFTMEAVSFP